MSSLFHITTLGCKINQYESQALREAWLARGLRETQDPSEAGLLLVNSCAVTARAVRDLRQTINRLHRSAPQGRIIVTGCAVEVVSEELRDMEGVDRVVPHGHKAALRDPETVALSVQPPPFALTISNYARARAVLKVQDGCSHFCTYCIVPLTRGPAVSRPYGAVLEEARRLLANNIRELVLSGVNLRQYSHEGLDFWDLLARLDRELAPQWLGRARLRLSSLEPGQLTAKGLEVLARCRLLCPHLHLSLQSGSPAVLQRMGRRHYTAQGVLGAVRQLEEAFPLLGLGADILAGFPGETDAEHADTRALVQELPLTYAHVFPYSKRPGTKAADMPRQVPHALKAARAKELRGMVQRKQQAFLHTLSRASVLRVLVETSAPAEQASGHCEYYASVALRGPLPHDACRSLCDVRPLHVHDGQLLAEPLQAEQENAS